MAVTIRFVHAGHNRLRYVMSTIDPDTDTGTITIRGAATPDVLTDLGANQGPLMQLAKVITQGYGQFASGVQTQAKARALWLSDLSGANPASGTDAPAISIVPTAICRLTVMNGSQAFWMVDANVDGSGRPELIVTMRNSSVDDFPAICYLDIYLPDAIGD